MESYYTNLFSIQVSFTIFLDCSSSLVYFNVTVALDGSGNFTKINDVVAASSSFSKMRYYIHIKAGEYKEYVEIGKNKTNLAFIGDGATNTKIIGNRSNVGGFSTMESSTMSVTGFGFMAQYLTFENSAGPANGQAVALRSDSNHSVFYKYIFLGYQDTLYARFNLQFYKECDIYGTMDFIFGSAATIFQNCHIYARLPNQQITVTVQGKDKQDLYSGFSIQNSIITTSIELQPVKASVKLYLGRPWRKFATTVIMQSFLDDIIYPKGWIEWPPTPLDQLYYREYNNTGPGANTNQRVNWQGYKTIQNSAEADLFIVSKFIDGDSWLPETGVPYAGGLVTLV
ncbi:hypothetical protein HHK36_022992 [Tetracentron sinense]|uniref:pectinesterase n=1 Tax=Tetracentron sinense TaxID=13715 RepID=A0A835D6K3_TETSI|nr:hypothetical protein HHK36_022992 [Tetracentron sinense]